MAQKTDDQLPKLPPGPRGVPVFGYLPYLKKEGNFARIAEKYGRETNSNIVLVDAYFVKMVLINKYEDIVEVFVNREDCDYRASSRILPMFKGIIFANGDFQKEHREFAMSVLRDSGICKDIVVRTVTEERRHFLRVLDGTGGLPIDPKHLMITVNVNVICQLMLGKRYDYDDEQLEDHLMILDKLSKGYGRSFAFKPWMWNVPECFDVLGVQAEERNLKRWIAFFSERIKEHVANLDPDNPKDYIDAYLLRKKEAPESYTDFQLGCEVIDMFFGSGENVAGTLLWAFLYMAKFPEIQAKVQRELDEKIDGDRLPTLEDKPSLPYTEAVFMEVQRKASVTPFGAPHDSQKDDIVIGGYHIPKGYRFAPNIYAVHHDPETWPDPHNFNPDNFLDEATGKFKNVDRLIPNGIGRRSCVGLAVARTEVFLLLTGCLKQFTIESKDPKELDGPPVGYVELPSTYHVCFKKRKN